MIEFTSDDFENIVEETEREALDYETTDSGHIIRTGRVRLALDEFLDSLSLMVRAGMIVNEGDFRFLGSSNHIAIYWRSAFAKFCEWRARTHSDVEVSDRRAYIAQARESLMSNGYVTGWNKPVRFNTGSGGQVFKCLVIDPTRAAHLDLSALYNAAGLKTQLQIVHDNGPHNESAERDVETSDRIPF